MGACGSKANKNFSGEGHKLTGGPQEKPSAAATSGGRAAVPPSVQRTEPQGHILGGSASDEKSEVAGDNAAQLRQKRLEAIALRENKNKMRGTPVRPTVFQPAEA